VALSSTPRGKKREIMPVRIEDCVVLYVEDDDPTACLFQMAIREVGTTPQIFRVTNGDHAHAFLTRTQPYQDAPTPDLVVLDLNLPGRNGLDVLNEIKRDPKLSRIPVYVFTSSDDRIDRAAATAAGARDYLTKGDSLDAFVKAARHICSGLPITLKTS
jgi:CheY-like chemotaxis protein